MGLKCTLPNPARRNAGEDGGTGRIIEEIQVWFFFLIGGTVCKPQCWSLTGCSKLVTGLQYVFFLDFAALKTPSVSRRLIVIKLAGQMFVGFIAYLREINVAWWPNKASVILCDHLPQISLMRFHFQSSCRIRLWIMFSVSQPSPVIKSLGFSCLGTVSGHTY